MERPSEVLLDAIRAAPNLLGPDDGIEEVYRFMDDYRDWLTEYKVPLLMTFAQMKEATENPSEVLWQAKKNFLAKQRFNQWQHIFFVSEIVPGTPLDFFSRAKGDIDHAIALAKKEEMKEAVRCHR